MRIFGRHRLSDVIPFLLVLGVIFIFSCADRMGLKVESSESTENSEKGNTSNAINKEELSSALEGVCDYIESKDDIIDDLASKTKNQVVKVQQFNSVSDVDNNWDRYIDMPENSENIKIHVYTYNDSSQSAIVEYIVNGKSSTNAYFCSKDGNRVKIECQSSDTNNTCGGAFHPTMDGGTITCGSQSDNCSMLITNINDPR